MDLELKGKTVLVTGASKGIGYAVAEGFAAEGCHLHLVARTEADLAAAKARLHAAHGTEVAIHPLDLSRGEAVRSLAETCGDVDILVNNAGAIPAGDLQAIDEARWREAWDLKVLGYINMTREYYRRMEERGRGTIVNVIGLGGERLDPGYVAGSTGNASLMAFTRAVGSTSIDRGVRILAVNPGAVDTDRIATIYRTKAETELGDASRWREFFEGLPLKRPAKPEEVADVVVFLASARAAYLSGIVVPIDGGMGARSSI